MLSIIYKDTHLVAVNKPSGLIVHRSLIDKQATEFALQIVRDQLGLKVFPVHRLDKPTSGVLIFALSKDSARSLANQFEHGFVQKSYLAIVRGESPESLNIDHPLREELDKKADANADQTKLAQSASTKIITVDTVELPVVVDKYPTSKYSLVKAYPKTGRKHQVRRHLRHIGHPIIGDVNHGSGKHNRFFRTQFNINRLLLACTEISIKHPVDEKEITLVAPLASDFQSVINKLGFKYY